MTKPLNKKLKLASSWLLGLLSVRYDHDKHADDMVLRVCNRVEWAVIHTHYRQTRHQTLPRWSPLVYVYQSI